MVASDSSVSFPRSIIPPAVLRVFNTLRSGFLLMEAILAIAIFGLFLTAVGMVLLLGQESSIVGGDRVRGASFSDELLEASRAIRDSSFASLTAGAHGVALNGSQQWIYSGTQSTRSGGYILSATVTSLGSDWVRVSAQTKWKHGYNRSGSVLLTTELSDWRAQRAIGDWSSIAVDGSYVDGGSPLFNAVAIAGNYAYVTSDTSSGGAGLYVFDISNTASPTRVADTFNLGTSGYGIAAKGKTLYVVTGDATQEIRAYNITTPTALAADKLIASHNLSGSSLALSLSLHGQTLLVGTRADATWNELYTFNVQNTGAILPLSSLEVGSSVNAIALTGTSAILATGDTAAEMKTVQMSTTGNLMTVTNGDYNVTSTEAGLSVAATGTSAVLGRQKGSIQEFALFDMRTGGGSPPGAPGPWYHEGSGSLVGVDADPGKCYGFLAAVSGRKALQVVNLRDTSLTELTTYTSTSGYPRGLLYDPVRDRVYLLTRSAFLIFKPVSTPGSCS